jgi:hypothetical protein
MKISLEKKQVIEVTEVKNEFKETLETLNALLDGVSMFLSEEELSLFEEVEGRCWACLNKLESLIEYSQ